MTSPLPSPSQRTARIIDAGINRAREGLRVLEDLARFGLDDTDLSTRAKNLRHDLARAASALPVRPCDLLASRDTPGDVGTDISTAAEQVRPDEDALAAAAAARATEALRSIEEASKLLGDTGSAFERIRYQTYELERLIRLRVSAPGVQWRLCVLLTENLCHRPWQEVARGSIAGGADCLQLREKDLTDRELLARAKELVALAGNRAAVIINDRPDIALLAGATGVHLGQTDLPAASIRSLSRDRLVVGVSCTTIDQAREAASDGAHYLGLGPMFQTTTKAKPRLAGPEFLRACLSDAAVAHIPHLAIGGIGPENIKQLAESGCRGVAICASVCKADDPERICRALLAYLPETGPTSTPHENDP
jgi:thiamine-phosphate pyrophosphorylase